MRVLETDRLLIGPREDAGTLETTTNIWQVDSWKDDTRAVRQSYGN
jgi:hypothetical protein